MESFVGLFDPGSSSDDGSWESSSSSGSSLGSRRSKGKKGQQPKHKHNNLLLSRDPEAEQLPPEPQLGNVEYKLKLVNPSRLRFEHLVTQMKWRLREGQGEAIYEIGVEDSGVLTGLSGKELRASLQTLRHMAQKLGATTTVLRERLVNSSPTKDDNDEQRRVAEVLVRKVPDDQHSIEVRVAVVGSADAGKSTLLGVLTQGQLDNGRGRARLNMFRHLHEIQSGRTSSISHEILGFDSRGSVLNYKELVTHESICESSTKLVSFLDLAGHQKYLKTTVLGLTGYYPHHVMLVVSAGAGLGGMAQEHLGLVLALDVPLFVIVTKMDLGAARVQATLEALETALQSAPHGLRRVPLLVQGPDDVMTAANASAKTVHSIVPIFCVSSVTGEGLDLLRSFLFVIPPELSANERDRLEQEPCEFQVDETFRVPEVGVVVGGLLTQGVISEGMNMVIGPMVDGTYQPVQVQSVHRNKAAYRVVRASQSASLALHPEVPGLRKGMVLLSPDMDQDCCIFFQATVHVIYHATAIHEGFQCTVHLGNIRQTAVIVGIMASSGIHTDERASVVFKLVRHPERIQVGQRVLFREGRTKGIGKVTQVFPFSPDQVI
ncbi:GTP-binding protein 2 isoform X1 [Neocloeon triangulifer]|uniref:GTP-binding protein 2 isoform X1 n=1 Tax=Neocloeon triangulifer TaxID=2078957 RepID=UPI00286EE917|nr:GTP-binding protein 2 isoform X1 [Neocloeon triangulifer]XP_059475633.1 GTP-binding protein 2 isoform X1 [Neocloeon triangulifer]